MKSMEYRRLQANVGRHAIAVSEFPENGCLPGGMPDHIGEEALQANR